LLGSMQDYVISMLHPRLREVITRLGYTRLYPIQEKAIPVVLRGSHTLIVAPTGSGKTEAALFPVLSLMLSSHELNDGRIKAIYVTPLRALNRDLMTRISRLVEGVGISIALRHGDSTSSIRRRFLESPPDFMITTPETLNLLLTVQAKADMWNSVSYVIVDEVQELIESERGSELSVVLERLQERSRNRIQRIGLSATLSDKSKRFAASLLAYGRKVEVIEDKGERAYEIEIVAVPEDEGLHKASDAIASIASREKGSVLLFTNTRSVAERLGVLLSKRLANKVMVHHGSLSREVREEAERKFREGELKVLVATSSMELGIDIGHIDRVVQFMSPREVIAMSQRAGRAEHRYGGVSRATIVAFNNVFELLESAVIAARTRREDLEDLAYHRKPLDVAAHQLVAMVIEGLASDIGKAHEVLTRSAPFSDMTLSELEKVASHLDSVGVLKYERETGKLARGRRSLTYLYKVSMIPDEATFRVYDVASGSQVGEVGERFVEAALLASREQKPVFVLAGRAWRIVNVDYEELRIDAEPLGEAEGVVPSWEGELIPVSYKVAREVCSLVSLASIDPQKALHALLQRGLDRELAERITSVIAESAKRWGAPLTPLEPIVEELKGASILFTCLGSKGNLLLALAISKLLEPKVKAWFDYIPYAVVFSAPYGVRGDDIREALLKAKNMDLPELIALAYDAIKETPLYVVRFLQVAKRLGVLDPDARVSLEQGKRILDAYRGSVVEEETLRELSFDKLDPEALREFLSNLKDVRVVRSEGPSPLAQDVIKNPYLRREVAVNLKEVAMEYVIEGLRRAALRKEVMFVCASCGNTWRAEAAGLSHPVRCPKCGAAMVAPLPSSQWGESVASLYSRWKRGSAGKLSKDERRLINEVRERAELYINYAMQGLGRYVVEALMNQGVGPRSAKKVMESLMRGGERAFYEALLKAKEEYLVYKKFIDKREGKEDREKA